MKGKYILTLFPNEKFFLIKETISEIAKGQGLRASHISGCLNHPDKHKSHRGYKFIRMDGRITKLETAYRHAPRYAEKIKG